MSSCVSPAVHFDEGLLCQEVSNEEPMKLALCVLLQHLCDCQVRGSLGCGGQGQKFKHRITGLGQGLWLRGCGGAGMEI